MADFRPILSEQDLAWRLGVPLERLRNIARRARKQYGEFPIKKGFKVRVVRPPHPELKRIQERLKENIFDRIALPAVAHGGVIGKSPNSNAKAHLGKPCVINIDVRGFFDEVRHRVVYRMLRKELGFGREVARLITQLTTLKAALPQGSPTSTALANLVLAAPVDTPISRSAQRLDVEFTRFVDDMSFSGSNPRPLINEVGKLLSRRGLPMHRKKGIKPKLKITPRSRPQVVTGLNVNCASRPSVPRKYRDNLRAAIYALRNTGGNALPAAVSSVRGKIEHVRRFNPGSARRMDRYLEENLPRD